MLRKKRAGSMLADTHTKPSLGYPSFQSKQSQKSTTEIPPFPVDVVDQRPVVVKKLFLC